MLSPNSSRHYGRLAACVVGSCLLLTQVSAEITNTVYGVEAHLDYALTTNLDDPVPPPESETSTDGLLDLTITRSGKDLSGDPWSLTGTALLTSSADLQATPDSLTFSGSLSTELSLSSTNFPFTKMDDQVWLSADNSGSPTMDLKGNVAEVFFDTDLYLDFHLEVDVVSNNGATIYAYLLRQEPAESPAYFEDGVGTFRETFTSDFSFDATMHQGNYLLRIFIVANENEDAEISFTFTASTDPEDPYIAEPPEGGYPLFGSPFGVEEVNIDDLVPANMEILNETDLGDGTTEIEYTLDLRNDRDDIRDQASIDIEQVLIGEPNILQLPGSLDFDPIDPGLTVPPQEGEVLRMVVDNADLSEVRSSLLAGERLLITSSSVPHFTHKPTTNIAVIELEDVNGVVRPAVSDNSFNSAFNYEQDLEKNASRGLLLLAESSPLVEIPGVVPTYFVDGYKGLFPFIIGEIKDSGLGAGVLIEGRSVDITDVLVDGKINGSLQPASAYYDGGHYVDSTAPRPEDGAPAESTVAAFPFPVAFNEIAINDLIRLNGSVYVNPGEFGIELAVDADSADSEIMVYGELTIDLDLLVEILDGVDNSAQTLAGTEVSVVTFPLFTASLPNGFTLIPEFSINLATIADATAGFAFPFNSEVEVSFRAGVRNGLPVHESSAVIKPQPVTDITFHHNVDAGVTTEVEFQVDFVFYPANQPLLATGPTLSAAAVADLAVDTNQSPIWQLDANLELRGGVTVELVEFFDVAEAETVVDTIPMFSSTGPDAAVPVAAPASGPQNGILYNPGLQPLYGEAFRWMRSIRSFEVLNESEDLFAVPLATSADLIVGDGESFNRLTEDGGLLWTKHAQDHNPVDGVSEPDGGYTLLTRLFSQIQLTRYDAADNLVWMQAWDSPDDASHHVLELVRKDTGGGLSEYFVLTRTTLPEDFSTRHTGLIKFDDAGSPVWYKVYKADAEDPNTNPSRMICAADGDLIITGVTDIDVTGASTIANLSDNIFLTRIDSETGLDEWTHVYAWLRAPVIEALMENPDTGDIFIGGNAGLAVSDDTPPMLLANIQSDGTWFTGVQIGAEDPALETIFDTIQDLKWIDNRMWMAGNLSQITGISNSASAFVARFTKRLGVTRHTLFAGPDNEVIRQIEPTADGQGLVAIAETSSFLPWPTGAEEDGAHPASRLIMRLPWENMLRFHELSAGRQDSDLAESKQAGVHFIEPRLLPVAGEESFYEGTQVTVLLQDELTLESATPTAEPIGVDTFEFLALEKSPGQIPEDAEDYFDWSQIDPGGNEDADDLTNIEELFWGTDLFLAGDEPGVLFIEESLIGGEDFLDLYLYRSSLADDLIPTLDSANASFAWQPEDDFELFVSPFTPDLDELRFRVPKPQGAGVKTFYRVSLPTNP